MNKTAVWIVGAAILGGGWFWFRWRGDSGPEIEYRYAKVAKGELMRSISATGQLVALTSVDVKSKAGGKVVKLYVEEGALVKKGDLIAEIDPTDTKAAFDQAQADYDASAARADSARYNSDLQNRSSESAVREAEVNLEVSRVRLRRAESQNNAQPALTNASLGTAGAQLKSAEADLRQLQNVTIPQLRRDAQAQVNRSRVDLENAQAEVRRTRELYTVGYSARNEVEKAEGQLAAAQASFDTVSQKLSTLEKQIEADLSAQKARVQQAREGANSAKASGNQVDLAKISLEEARKAVQQAEIALKQARDARIQDRVRESEIRQAQSSIVRSRVSLSNAKVQLESTTVTAPRDGVVTLKYLEEGTIIPPGTSTFSQGTSLVQISDTTTMYVECAVDEADIAQVKEGQDVKIIIEAYPGIDVMGKVTRINPAAATANNITAIKVRVAVEPTNKVVLKPGMNANCEFITLAKKGVLTAPMQAIKRDDQGSYVMLKDKVKPVRREVKTGAMGNDSIEVLEGLKEGEEVVVAEINLKELKETQKKMLEAQQGGGGLGASQQRGMSSGRSPMSQGGGGGGARSGGR
ncbi:MAG: efflux RND transporter periplasmic adaptor subunit [Armatimonadetes bacterium]|nr:efflux RND transporter periplasmic adaptor subunit [Armatimonadota bacterium]